MKQKLLFLLGIIAMLCLTGCGAEVTSKIKFNPDGSGMRSVSAVISESDYKNLDGGFTELDMLLEEAAPEGLNLNRHIEENGDALYEFSFFFDNIEDYNQKISSITGKQHNATWYTTQSIFLSDIQFQEEQCTYDLISWALTAFKKSKYSKWYASNLKPYKIGENEVYLEDEQVYKGTGNPWFKKEMAVKVKTVSIYNAYDYDNKRSKTIVIQFNKGDLERINIEEAKILLDGYSKDYKIDLANSTITFELSNEEITSFIRMADLEVKDTDLVYESVFNPFQRKLVIQEEYNLGQFFSLFQLEYPYIYNYIKLPEDVEDINISHTNQIGEVPVPDGYQYAGAFRYDSDYQISFRSNTMVNINRVTVNYVVTDDLEVKRYVELEFSKNDCPLQKSELIKYYPNMEESIRFSEQEDSITIQILDRVKQGDVVDNEKAKLHFNYKTRVSLKNLSYQFQDQLEVSKYLKTLTDYTWDLLQIPVTYQLTIGANTGITDVVMNGTQYELTQTEPEKEYVVSISSTMSEPMNVSLQFKQMDPMFYFWIAVVVFLIIVGILSYVLIRMRNNVNKDSKELAFQVHWLDKKEDKSK